MPASSPFSSISFRLQSSSFSHMSIRRMPGLAIVCMYDRTCRCTSAAFRTELTMSASARSCARFSSSVSRHR